jgi:hypothetical protein
MATERLTASVDSFVRATKERLTAVVRSSVQDLVNEIQTPVAKGGKMRVDTGFLRSSGKLSLTGMPSGLPRGEADQKYDFSPVSSISVLSQFKIGDTIYFGWTANYAIYREAYDGFLASGVQNWQQIVNKNARILKNRINGQ